MPASHDDKSLIWFELNRQNQQTKPYDTNALYDLTEILYDYPSMLYKPKTLNLDTFDNLYDLYDIRPIIPRVYSALANANLTRDHHRGFTFPAPAIAYPGTPLTGRLCRSPLLIFFIL